MIHLQHHKPILSTLLPSITVRRSAERVYNSISFVSVHLRANPWVCPRETNIITFCPYDDTIYRSVKIACVYNETYIRQEIASDQKIVLFTDGISPKHDRTFSHRDNQPFPEQMWSMTLSETHFGNPISSIDYVVAHWRAGRDTRPRPCYGVVVNNTAMSNSSQ